MLPGDHPTPDDVRRLCDGSWLTPELVEAARVRRVDDATARALVGRNGTAGKYQGLAFPYFLPGEEHVREYRVRRDRPDIEYKNGKPKERQKYIAPPGRGNALYFTPGAALETLGAAELPLALTEGEKKALALHRLATWECGAPRWLAVGLSGVWNWRGTVGKTQGANGQRADVKGPIGDLDRFTWEARTVYLVFDNDVHSNDSVRTARRMLAEELKSRGARVLLVTLPERDGVKLGADDLLAQDGPEALLALFDAATESGDPDLTRQPYTDAGNAERLLLLHRDGLRYVAETKQWSFYDGLRWTADTTGAVRRFAVDAMRQTHRQAATIEDSDQRKTLERHARNSEQARAVRDGLSMAQCFAGTTVSVTEFDRRPFLLNCTNGTIDLETGRLLPHRRSDNLAKLCPQRYDPSAECPTFLRFLAAAMGDREGASDGQVEQAHTRIHYLHKAVGMSLTADVSEKLVFCLFGPTDTGKTTFLNAIRFALGGDYAGQVLIDSLMANTRQSDNNSKADLVDLLGKRFVTTSEAEASQRLAEGRLKYLTQGAYSRIKAARKYENPIEFTATHKIWLDANERPQIRTSDSSVWERLKPIPFECPVTGGERDSKLPAKLQAEAVGILAWAVQGCERWLKEGLGEIPDIAEARQDWRSECDPLTDFLADHCELNLDADESFAFVSEVWQSYQNWGQDNGERYLLSRRRFKERLRALGCTEGRRYDDMGKQHRTWEGLTLK